MVPDEMITAMLDKYTASNSHVKFEYEVVPFADYFNKLGLALGSGLAADTFMVNEVWAYADAKQFAPAPEVFAKDVRENFGAAGKPPDYKGNVYGYPLEGGLRMVIYNKDHFAEAGIADPANDGCEDWAQLLEWSKALTKKQGNETLQEGWKINQPGYWIAVAEWFWMAGGEFCTDECKEFKLDQKAWLDAVQWWADCALVHKVADMKFAADTFDKGQSAMTVYSLSTVGQMRKFSQINYGAFMNPPQVKGGQRWHDDGPWMYGVNAAAKPEAQEESWKFLQWLTNDENGVEMAKEYISIFRTSAIQAAMPHLDPVLTRFFEADSHVHPRTPKYWRIWVTRVQGALTKVYLGEMSVKDSAVLVEGQINDDIKTASGSL